MKKIQGLHHTDLEHLAGTSDWLYSVSDTIDFYEVWELWQAKEALPGNSLAFLYLPDLTVHTPFEPQPGVYYETFAVNFYQNSLYFIQVDFHAELVKVWAYQPLLGVLRTITALPFAGLSFYNLRLSFAPLRLNSQDFENYQVAFYYPERFDLPVQDNEAFRFSEGERYYFSDWVEEGLDEAGQIVGTYRYYETYLVKDREGRILERGVGALTLLPDGQWYII